MKISINYLKYPQKRQLLSKFSDSLFQFMQLSPFCFNNVEDIVDRGWIVLEYTRLEDIL